MNVHRIRAAHAEELVAQALTRQNWRILARNFRHTGFELDIVAMKAATLVTVEVKYRQRWDVHVFESLLPKRKYEALQRGLLHYVRRNAIRAKTLRVDLALILQAAPTQTPTLRYWAGVTKDACK